MATILRPRPCPSLICRRSFGTTACRSVSLQLDKNDPEAVKDIVPEYPYGPTRWYKQSRLGLYGGQRLQFGNNVGEKFEVKTRRRWHLNVKTKKLWSQALNAPVQLRVTTRTLRTIDKHGGLDEYLLGEKEARIKELGESGWWLRWAIMQTPHVRKRFAAERAALGVDELAQSSPAPPDDTAEPLVERLETEELAQSSPAPPNDTAEPAVERLETAEYTAQWPEWAEEAPPVPETPVPETPLPRIRFRTGRKRHLQWTPDGWRRARPALELSVRKQYTESINELVADRLLEVQELLKDEDLNRHEMNLVLDRVRNRMRSRLHRLKWPSVQAQVEAKKEEIWQIKGAAALRRVENKRRREAPLTENAGGL